MVNNNKQFLGHIICDCAAHGVKVIFERKRYVLADSAGLCLGYFSEEDKEICIASKNNQYYWFTTLIHEYCHFKQWSEKEPLFIRISNSVYLDNDIWDWLEGKDIPQKRVIKSIKAYQLMEKNCEERTVKVIQDNELDINLKEYIISSNLYILFYSILLKTRRWYKTSPFIIRPLFDYVPCDKIVEDFRITKNLEKKIIEYCY